MNRLIVISILLLVLTSVGAAANNTNTDSALLHGDLKSLSLGDTVQTTATVVNRLPITDTIRITLGGSALEGIISAHTVDTPSDITCLNAMKTKCLVTVRAESQRDVNITVTATATGQGILIGTVNSTTTDLANSDQLDVRVGPHYRQNLVSAPGLTSFQILVLAFLAGTAVLLRRD